MQGLFKRQKVDERAATGQRPPYAVGRDVLVHTLGFLSVRDLLLVETVSKEWKRAFDQAILRIRQLHLGDLLMSPTPLFKRIAPGLQRFDGHCNASTLHWSERQNLRVCCAAPNLRQLSCPGEYLGHVTAWDTLRELSVTSPPANMPFPLWPQLGRLQRLNTSLYALVQRGAGAGAWIQLPTAYSSRERPTQWALRSLTHLSLTHSPVFGGYNRINAWSMLEDVWKEFEFESLRRLDLTITEISVSGLTSTLPYVDHVLPPEVVKRLEYTRLRVDTCIDVIIDGMAQRACLRVEDASGGHEYAVLPRTDAASWIRLMEPMFQQYAICDWKVESYTSVTEADEICVLDRLWTTIQDVVTSGKSRMTRLFLAAPLPPTYTRLAEQVEHLTVSLRLPSANATTTSFRSLDKSRPWCMPRLTHLEFTDAYLPSGLVSDLFRSRFNRVCVGELMLVRPSSRATTSEWSLTVATAADCYTASAVRSRPQWPMEGSLFLDVLQRGIGPIAGLIIGVNLYWKRAFELILVVCAAIGWIMAMGSDGTQGTRMLRNVFVAHSLTLLSGRAKRWKVRWSCLGIATLVTVVLPVALLMDSMLVMALIMMLVWRHKSMPYAIDAFALEWAFALVAWPLASALDQTDHPTWMAVATILRWCALVALSCVPVSPTIDQDVCEPCLLLNADKGILRKRTYYPNAVSTSGLAWFHTLPLFGGDDTTKPRSFFPWSDVDAMWQTLDTQLEVWACQGITPGELAIFLSTRKSDWEDDLGLPDTGMKALHSAIVSLANQRRDAIAEMRGVLTHQFTDAELTTLRRETRRHTLEWTGGHTTLHEMIVEEDEELSQPVRHAMRMYAMHAIQSDIVVSRDHLSDPFPWGGYFGGGDGGGNPHPSNVYSALQCLARSNVPAMQWILDGQAFFEDAKRRGDYKLTVIGSTRKPLGTVPLHRFVHWCLEKTDQPELHVRCAGAMVCVYYAWRQRPRKVLEHHLALVQGLADDISAYCNSLWDSCPDLPSLSEPFHRPGAETKSGNGPTQWAGNGPTQWDISKCPTQWAWGRICHGVYGGLVEHVQEWCAVQPTETIHQIEGELTLQLATCCVPVAMEESKQKVPFAWKALLWLAFVIEYVTGQRLEQTLALTGQPRPFVLPDNRPMAHMLPNLDHKLMASWVKLLCDLARETPDNLHV